MRQPGEFFKRKEESLEHTLFANNLAKYIASAQYHSMLKNFHFLPETTHVYLRIDSHKPPLHAVYQGPFKVLDKSEKYFIIDFRTHKDKVTVDHLKILSTMHTTTNACHHISLSRNINFMLFFTENHSAIASVSTEGNIICNLERFLVVLC